MKTLRITTTYEYHVDDDLITRTFRAEKEEVRDAQLPGTSRERIQEIFLGEAIEALIVLGEDNEFAQLTHESTEWDWS